MSPPPGRCSPATHEPDQNDRRGVSIARLLIAVLVDGVVMLVDAERQHNGRGRPRVGMRQFADDLPLKRGSARVSSGYFRPRPLILEFRRRPSMKAVCTARAMSRADRVARACRHRVQPEPHTSHAAEVVRRGSSHTSAPPLLPFKRCGKDRCVSRAFDPT